MSYYEPSSPYLESMPYEPVGGYGSQIGGYGPPMSGYGTPMSGYGTPMNGYGPPSGYGYNPGYSMPGYGGYGYDAEYPYDDGYYGGSPYYGNHHSYYVSNSVTKLKFRPPRLVTYNDNRADIATAIIVAATARMVRGCITNIKHLEIGLWVLLVCLSHIYIDFEAHGVTWIEFVILCMAVRPYPTRWHSQLLGDWWAPYARQQARLSHQVPWYLTCRSPYLVVITYRYHYAMYNNYDTVRLGNCDCLQVFCH